jgi:hypothetical protein
MKMLWNMEKADMLEKHIVFQEEDRDTYIQSILKQ